jgi:diaminohydroxyphosphoribosylaminopyrimidine deaminase / 5-amino-6-(5-phosphoribosylamino)uracil reductase
MTPTALHATGAGAGARGLGRVWPNPAVGCVIVKDGRIVGRGWTQPGGRPHAETEALAQAGAAARGATAYVSLEPCAHHGRTPPCAEALVAAGVARVVSALTDPDPRVAGRRPCDAARGRDRGDRGGRGRGGAGWQAGFLSRVRAGRPMVTLKLALTLDGRIATATGESRWITGPEARRRVHLMRATMMRCWSGRARRGPMTPICGCAIWVTGWQPVRVVADSRLGLPRTAGWGAARSGAGLAAARASAAPGALAWRRRGAELFGCATDALGRLDMADALRQLGARADADFVRGRRRAGGQPGAGRAGGRAGGLFRRASVRRRWHRRGWRRWA